MLVLTRREGESIDIGNDIVVKVSAIKGDRVLVGIQAPTTVGIMRSELKDAGKPRRSAAAGGGFGATFTIEVEAPSITTPGAWVWRSHPIKQGAEPLSVSQAYEAFKGVQAEAALREKGPHWGIVKTWRAVRVMRHGRDGKTVVDAARLGEPGVGRSNAPASWMTE